MSILAAKTNEPIPGYRVIQRIGAGGYGEVWTAQAPGDLTKAIKFVYGLLDEDRAARELKALNRIKGVRHPFLLSLERIEVVDGQLVIVTELADGSLKDRFDEYRKKGQPGIPRDELLSYLRDAADALDYMSDQHSLQHLDVKPENLLLLGGRTKVADFGLVKDIHDHTASLMGGLTPVYAPPEVFEGRPSRKSDQYSLAIVYQEMLTGVLPFPGRTAAQLAAQHLNAKPRLSSLPINDQASVARALAKKPTERYATCRELIDELTETGKRPTGPAVASPASRQPEAEGRSLSSATSGATQAGSMTSGAIDPSQAATAPRTPDQMLAHLDEAAQLAASAATGEFPAASSPRMTHATGGGAILPDMRAVTDSGESYEPPPSLANLGAAPPLVDLPPVEADRIAWQPRPTLFLGIGGTGSRVLSRLKQRLNDRLDESMLPLFPLLALDSDARDLANLTHADGSWLRSEETISLPLRRTQDYRTDSRKLLEWLSRRWLYNIPRTQLTEGMRPLGRLALVDHAEQAFGGIRAALDALRTQNEASTVPPRVVIVSSIGGGTGGGMLTDVAYAVRQILDQLGMHEAEVLAVLTHATNRNPQQQELAAVNTLATLTELHQFHRGTTSFPGDPACGLKSRSAESPALNGAYLVHLGEELTNEQFEASCDRVAQFLMVDTITPAAPCLEAARQESREPGLLNLRTFGLCQIGFAQDRLVEHAVKRVSRSVVERWLGESKRAETKKCVKLLSAGEEAAKAQPAELNQHAAADARAGLLVQQFRLDIEPLMQTVQQLAADEMGGNPDQYFSGFLQPSAKTNEPEVDRWLGVIDDVFGRRAPEGATTPPPKLLLALESRITQLVRHMGSSVRQQIETLVDDPTLRVRGAQRVTKTIQGHLRALCDKLRDARNHLAKESLTLESQLHSSRPDAKAKNKGPRRSVAELQQLFLQCCRVRLLEMSAQIAGQIAHALQSHVVGSHDALIDLARDLHFLAVQLATDELLEDQDLPNDDLPAGEGAGPAGDSLAPLRQAVAEEIRQADDTLAQQLDQELSASALAAAGGLRGAMMLGGPQREELLAKLHAAARLAVLKKLASIDIAGSTLAAKEGDHPLRRLLADCQSWFQPCGGKRRLLCLVPQSVSQTLTPTAMAAQIGSEAFGQLPAIIPDGAGDVVLLYEIGELSIRHAAAAVIYQRPDLADLATRLHTRNDITWTPLLG